MNIILLSGGSGKRLWPLSNDIRSKQFIKIFKNENGEYESMLQRVYGQIKSVDSEASITIATSKSQVASIKNQLGDNVSISVEPCRRDTFPAIALATVYLHDILGIDENEVVIVSPVDPCVGNEYFTAFKQLEELAEEQDSNLILMGIEPTYPSEKYGYIIPTSKAQVSKVTMFKEKPSADIAADYIVKGGLWNGGVFAYKLKYVLEKIRTEIDYTDYYDLYSKYEQITKTSFDYAVVEKESNIKVLRFNGMWKDLGTWNTLTEAMESATIGEAVLNDNCNNVHVINDLDVPVLCMGLNNIVVAASPDGILVSDKEQSSYIKPYVDNFEKPVMYAEKSWGEFKVIDIAKESLTIKITLNKGHKMNYHSHAKRDEVWTIIQGKGKTIVEGIEQYVKPGDVITIEAGCKHTIIAETDLKIIEVQLGKEISVHDKEKFELEC
jgi:mannose-1-phosphate guanylyltransferase